MSNKYVLLVPEEAVPQGHIESDGGVYYIKNTSPAGGFTYTNDIDDAMVFSESGDAIFWGYRNTNAGFAEYLRYKKVPEKHMNEDIRFDEKVKQKLKEQLILDPVSVIQHPTDYDAKFDPDTPRPVYKIPDETLIKFPMDGQYKTITFKRLKEIFLSKSNRLERIQHAANSID